MEIKPDFLSKKKQKHKTKKSFAKRIASKAVWSFWFGAGCCNFDMLSILEESAEKAGIFVCPVNNPSKCDVLIVSGSITNKMAPVLRAIYEKMPEPRFVISIGACASFGGVNSSYSTACGCSKIIPVDIHVPGCPPPVETLAKVFSMLSDKIAQTV